VGCAIVTLSEGLADIKGEGLQLSSGVYPIGPSSRILRFVDVDVK